MKLDDYLKKHGISQTSFGELVGLTQTTVNKLCRQKQRPGWLNAQKIIAASNGEVTMEDLMIDLDYPMTKFHLPPPSHRDCDCTEHIVCLCTNCGKKWKLTSENEGKNGKG